MLKTPVSERRMRILEWLKDPVAHFPPQRHGDLVEDGVTVAAVAERLAVPRSVAATDLRILAAIGLLRMKRIRRRTYYRRDDLRITEVARLFEKGW
ncbi:helix-turn-helix domain-containing protein [Streptomyces glomeratus]|uniref:Helix-turn-helix domain-containing protein n=1 Tax=Streptomyces glomeratus TaxID=284452 RepID=A0ABP6LGV8_9ACTN|nr:helix-turn-helix domain-containing protein [Streptomyces glomeratus]MCF1509242.1 helix-turn-helix domain-containing protein [Streptomyces glomeratus]